MPDHKNIIKLVHSIKKAQLVREHYRRYILDGDNDKLSMDDLVIVVNDMYGTSIDLYEIDQSGSYIRGVYERYGDRTRIIVRANLSPEWKRFVVAKELSHVINDEREDWSAMGELTLQKMIEEQKEKISFSAWSPGTTSESVAYITAEEVLYPYAHRLIDAPRVLSRERSIAEIASHYEIPEAIVEHALNKNAMDCMAAFEEILK